MSREIRFRCWNNCLREYIPEDELMGSFGECLKEKHLYIEQYTGLTDKNGKEIYEGDIVALLFGYVPMKSVTTENIRIENAQKAVIHFDAARAAFRYTIKLRIPKDCQFKPGTKTNMVVIGNVHENPELLGGEE